MPNHNLDLLAQTARFLRPLLKELVFVGGSTTALLITDKGAAGVRASFDVDAIAEITSYPAYMTFSARLRELGFTEDNSEGAPVCRWRHNEIILDVMPLDKSILGFSNRWYKSAMHSAEEHELDAGLRIRVVTSVYFCATKLEAFAGRGNRDYFSSRDLEDLIALVDGRSEIIYEVAKAPNDVRSYIAAEIKKLLGTREFIDALPGYLLPDPASQARLAILITRLKKLVH